VQRDDNKRRESKIWGRYENVTGPYKGACVCCIWDRLWAIKIRVYACFRFKYWYTIHPSFINYVCSGWGDCTHTQSVVCGGVGGGSHITQWFLFFFTYYHFLTCCSQATPYTTQTIRNLQRWRDWKGTRYILLSRHRPAETSWVRWTTCWHTFLPKGTNVGLWGHIPVWACLLSTYEPISFDFNEIR
jgi:hypothetical protein